MRRQIRVSYLSLTLVVVAGCTAGRLYDRSGDEDSGISLVDGSGVGPDAAGDGASPIDTGAIDSGGMDTGGVDGVDSGRPRVDAAPPRDAGSPPFDAGSPTGIDADDMELFRLINEYRASLGLSAISLSPSLSEVARTHVADLMENGAYTGSCNLHSWSGEGDWSGCCYTPDHAQASCMWNKPRELTRYPGNGYEISTGGARDAAHALSLWQGSAGHHNVIINAPPWSEPWNAMGVAITPGAFAHVWFGREVDPG